MTKFLIWEGRGRSRPLPEGTVMLRLVRSRGSRVSVVAVNPLTGGTLAASHLVTFTDRGTCYAEGGVNTRLPFDFDEDRAVRVED